MAIKCLVDRVGDRLGSHSTDCGLRAETGAGH